MFILVSEIPSKGGEERALKLVIASDWKVCALLALLE
jgi:hypothetical protein